MQCRTCGAQIPAMAKVCPTCGTPAPYADETISNVPVSESQQAPTVYATPPPPPPPPPSPYNQSDPYPAYRQQAPTSYNPSGAGSYQGVPPNNYSPNSGAPPYFPSGQQMPGQPPRQKTPWGWIIGGIIVVVLLACVGSSLAAANFLKSPGSNDITHATATPSNASSPTSTAPTSTASTNGASPSGNPINATAAGIVTNPKLTSKVDDNTYGPVAGSETTKFKVNQNIYVTFTLNLNHIHVSSSQKAYVLVKFYADTTSVLNKEDPLVVDKSTDDAAYYGAVYYVPTDQGSAEVYWCRKADCSDRKLAQVVHFTVS